MHCRAFLLLVNFKMLKKHLHSKDFYFLYLLSSFSSTIHTHLPSQSSAAIGYHLIRAGTLEQTIHREQPQLQRHYNHYGQLRRRERRAAPGRSSTVSSTGSNITSGLGLPTKI